MIFMYRIGWNLHCVWRPLNQDRPGIRPRTSEVGWQALIIWRSLFSLSYSTSLLRKPSGLTLCDKNCSSKELSWLASSKCMETTNLEPKLVSLIARVFLLERCLLREFPPVHVCIKCLCDHCDVHSVIHLVCSSAF